MEPASKSKIKSISPQFLVADLDRAIEFYEKKLGFNLDFRYEDFYASVEKDGQSIHLKIGKYSTEQRQGRTENGGLDAIVSVEGIDALYATYTGRSMRIVEPLRSMPYGKEFYVQDPDGYLIGFVEPGR